MEICTLLEDGAALEQCHSIIFSVMLVLDFCPAPHFKRCPFILPQGSAGNEFSGQDAEYAYGAIQGKA